MSDRSSGRTALIWRDGHLIPWEQATLHVMSHVVHYGSSVFEGIRCYETPSGPAVFRLREHMRRLVDSCKIYRIELPWTVDQLVQATVDLVAANELRHCYLRPVVVRAGEQMGVLPFGVPIETFIVAWKWGTYLGADALEKGVDVCVSSWRRAAPGTFPTMAKAGGNYLNSQLAKMEARTDGYVEGITLDSFGYVAEGSGENLFVIRDGIIYTSGLDSAILNGITRDSVIRIARDLGYEVREERLPREMLYVADELFFTGTAAELTPIRSVDRIDVGEGKPGPITKAIQDRYMGIVTGRVADPYGWLTPVPVAEAVG
ncbi:branched-chain amino acid transaminase [Roseisolibacter agri]|uniref:Branched-chain-amino-acid aminotransferase n=1 Tax=Roseisolibacter agri TaxID=2014610 RepID=A0AA37QET0_9BACT|nr:branched-chain amino acid transaminase [Roseisolibacter agri]GLC28516.1 branched chain amino acid aminotransferase [Roseisolibacter agri]